MSNAITYFTGYSDYPISKLNKLKFNEKALMELVVDDYGDGVYVNRKTTIGTFYDFLISSHPIFNKIDDVYNDKTYPEVNEYTNQVSYRYSSDIYISGQTYFAKNPYSLDETEYLKLFSNQTVQKRQLEKFIHDNALEINSIKNGDTIVQYGLSGWDKCDSDSENVRLDVNSIVKFQKPNSGGQITKVAPDNTIPFYHSNSITFYSNVFATFVGKVKIPYTENQLNHRMSYYSLETNLWVGIWEGKNIIAISELHNIENNIAYFSFQLPVSRGKKYYIVAPFKPAEPANDDESTNTAYDMFSNIPVNWTSIFYYSPSAGADETIQTYFNVPTL